MDNNETNKTTKNVQKNEDNKNAIHLPNVLYAFNRASRASDCHTHQSKVESIELNKRTKKNSDLFIFKCSIKYVKLCILQFNNV